MREEEVRLCKWQNTCVEIQNCMLLTWYTSVSQEWEKRSRIYSITIDNDVFTNYDCYELWWMEESLDWGGGLHWVNPPEIQQSHNRPRFHIFCVSCLNMYRIKEWYYFYFTIFTKSLLVYMDWKYSMIFPFHLRLFVPWKQQQELQDGHFESPCESWGRCKKSNTGGELHFDFGVDCKCLWWRIYGNLRWILSWRCSKL